MAARSADGGGLDQELLQQRHECLEVSEVNVVSGVKHGLHVDLRVGFPQQVDGLLGDGCPDSALIIRP